jgi:hypothetical protein
MIECVVDGSFEQAHRYPLTPVSLRHEKAIDDPVFDRIVGWPVDLGSR